MKGIAIIMMFCLHILKTEWIFQTDLIWDVSINQQNLSAIIARTFDLCITIFAFISGYGWSKNKNINGIKKIITIYVSYYTVLLLWGGPLYWIFQEGAIHISAGNLLSALLAVSSNSVRYCWYISFYALAILTVKPIFILLNKWKIHVSIKILSVLFCGLFLRVIGNRLFAFGLINDTVLGVISHYAQYMPVVLQGFIVGTDSLDVSMMKIFNMKSKRTKMYIGFGGIFLILLIKLIAQNILNIMSNFDSILAIPFMVFLSITINTSLRSGIAERILLTLSKYSLFLWLTHNVLRYELVQKFIYSFRIPVVVIAVSLLIMLPISMGLEIISSKVTSFFLGLQIKHNA